jgi:hypothetical protein
LEKIWMRVGTNQPREFMLWSCLLPN